MSDVVCTDVGPEYTRSFPPVLRSRPCRPSRGGCGARSASRRRRRAASPVVPATTAEAMSTPGSTMAGPSRLCALSPPRGDPRQHGHTPPARYRRPPLTPRLATRRNQEGEGVRHTQTIARPRPATPVGNAPAAASKGREQRERHDGGRHDGQGEQRPPGQPEGVAGAARVGERAAHHAVRVRRLRTHRRGQCRGHRACFRARGAATRRARRSCGARTSARIA
jgi:hypothetical protein